MNRQCFFHSFGGTMHKCRLGGRDYDRDMLDRKPDTIRRPPPTDPPNRWVMREAPLKSMRSALPPDACQWGRSPRSSSRRR